AWMESVVPQQNHVSRGYLGFDRNDYPGDAAMADLRKEFAFTGYWLTPAPGGKTNSWTAKRKVLEAQGYGFMLLARGRAAKEIRTNEAPRKFGYWVLSDACPPWPGCVSVANPPLPASSGVKDATVWQFTRSPREKETAARCGGYAADENCYAVADAAKQWHLDMNVAASSNPSFRQ